MSRRERWRMFLAVLLVVVALDQAAKLWARTRLQGTPARVLWGGVARFEYAENRGAFLSLGADLPPGLREGILTTLNAGLVAVLGLYLARGRHLDRRLTFALSLLIAGGVGNLIDRLARGGAVVDFLILGLGRLHTGVFNVADFCLTAGAVLFAFSSSSAAARESGKGPEGSAG